ncbi:MAG: hypothetical protein AB7R77_24875 [Ilumatobacteraceae bacterium]|jgi:hypothetical protein
MDVRERRSTPRWVRLLVFAGALLVGFLWVAVAHPFEGRVVYELGSEHGIHRYDFLAFIPPLVALAWVLRAD